MYIHTYVYVCMYVCMYVFTYLCVCVFVSVSLCVQFIDVIILHTNTLQWFGNLVTMAWWDGLWLNEGFASYVEYIGSNHSQPDWNMVSM